MSDAKSQSQNQPATDASPRGESAAPDGAHVPTLEGRLAAAIAERDANYDRWVRTQADFENYRRRVNREADEARKYQSLPLVRDLLPAVDNLQRAIAAAETVQKDPAGKDPHKAINELLQGVRMVAKQVDEILARHHAVPIEAVGLPFDPNVHEALTQVQSAEHPPGTVIQEAERGYRLHDRIVRPSRVIVAAAPP